MRLEETDVVFALKDGVLTHISNVESGLECGCVCAGCGTKMVAKKGQIKAHHFAHLNAECAHAYESMVHYICKNAFMQMNNFVLPDYYDDRYRKVFGNFKITGAKVQLDKFEIKIEYKYFDIIADVALLMNNKPVLFIEIANTHFIDDVKLSKLKKYGISCLEIDISKFHVDFHYLPSDLSNWMSVQSIKEYMEDKSKWIINVKMQERYKIERLKEVWIENAKSVWNRFNRAKSIVYEIKARDLNREFEYFYNNQDQ